MGTHCSTHTMKGSSMSEAYRDACREAKEEYGHRQGYSGHINCTHTFRDVTAAYKAAKDKNKFIEEAWEKQYKGDCYGVELTPPKRNTNKVKTKVEIKPQKGTKKWETRYVVEQLFDRGQIASEKTQGAAIKKARAYCEKNQCTCRIYISKVMTKGSTHVADVSYKPSKTEKDGEYLFIYSASE